MNNKTYKWLYQCIGNDQNNEYEKITTKMIKDIGYGKVYKTIWETSVSINIFIFFVVGCSKEIDKYCQIIKSKDSITNIVAIKQFSKMVDIENITTLYHAVFYIEEANKALAKGFFNGIYDANDIANDMEGYFSV